MAVELGFEAEETYERAVQYGSQGFQEAYCELIDRHAGTGQPFRPFIPIVHDEAKYRAWTELCTDLPDKTLREFYRYVGLCRLLNAVLENMKSDEFVELQPDRKKAVISNFAQINSELATCCRNLTLKLELYTDFGRLKYNSVVDPKSNNEDDRDSHFRTPSSAAGQSPDPSDRQPSGSRSH